MNTTTDTVTEADVLGQLVSDGQPGLSPEAAQAILSLRFSPAAIARMNELAERSRQGTLSEMDRREQEKYLRVANLVNVLQAHALLSLSATAGAGN